MNFDYLDIAGKSCDCLGAAPDNPDLRLRLDEFLTSHNIQAARDTTEARGNWATIQQNRTCA
ncbi:MAG: hypothetical protein R3E95_03615 [Thiolinea sp.]